MYLGTRYMYMKQHNRKFLPSIYITATLLSYPYPPISQIIIAHPDVSRPLTGV